MYEVARTASTATISSWEIRNARITLLPVTFPILMTTFLMRTP